VTSDLEILKRVHFVQPENGLIPRNFPVDPSKVHKIETLKPAKPGDNRNTHTFRYVIAVAGDDREQAAHEFHDRVLRYPTKHGIFALYGTQIGTAKTMLNLNPVDQGNVPGAPKIKKLSKEDIERIKTFRDHLHGHRMLIIRGAFESEKEFIEALTRAAQSRPDEHDFTPRLPSMFVDFVAIDPLLAVSAALKTAGTKGKQIAPNVPASRAIGIVSDLAIASSAGIENAANRLHELSTNRQCPIQSR